MSLFLGKTGRKILAHTTRNPRVYYNRAADAAGRTMHKYFPDFTPGLTRETYKLWEQIQSGHASKITIRNNGFYDGTQLLCGSALVSEAFLRAGIRDIDTRNVVGPEYLANMPREKMFLAMHSTLSLVPFALTFVTSLYEIFQIGAPGEASISDFLLLGSSCLFCVVAAPVTNIFGKFARRQRYADVYCPPPTLLEVEAYAVEIFELSSESSIEGLGSPCLPGKIFFQKGPRSRGYFDNAIVHEKAHILGASETEACALESRATLKDYFSGKISLRIFPRLLAATLFHHLLQLRLWLGPYRYLKKEGLHRGFLAPCAQLQLMALRGQIKLLSSSLEKLLSEAYLLNASDPSQPTIFNNQLLQADYYEALGEKTRACELREAFVAYSLYSVRQLLEIEPGLIEIKETATATNDEALLNKMAQVERELKKTKRESGDLVARPIIQIALYYYDQGNYDEALRQLEALDSLGKHHSLSLGSYFYYMRLQEALRNRIKSIHC